MTHHRECITHHYACDCREAEIAEILADNQVMREALEEIRNQACVCDGENAKLRRRWLIDRCQEALAAISKDGK